MSTPQIQEIRQTQTSIPDYAKRYAEDLLGHAAATIYKTSGVDASGMPIITGFQPYRPYTGERVAQFTPLQHQAFEAAGQLQVPGQMYDASQIAKKAATMAGESAYKPSDFRAATVMAPNLERFQMGPAEQVYAREYNAPVMTAAQMAYDPNLRNYQMGPAEEVRTQSFARPGTSEMYMSPYMQDVVGVQQREAQRQANIAATQRGAKFAQAGAFGGARQAIENAEAQRNLATQMGDIQATGLQNAFQQAQAQFNADQARALAAAQSNQQAGLTVGGQNLQSLLNTQQLGANIGLQGALGNLNAAQQANVQNIAAQLQTQGLNAEQAMRAALANQQMGMNVGQQNLQALLGVQQLGAQNSMQAQIANQLALQNAAQLREQSAQYGAGFGLQGLQTALSGAGTLGNLGQNIWAQNLGNLNMQNLFGGQQREQMQNILNNQYQDYLARENLPYRHLGFMSDILRGTQGLGQQSIYKYEAPQSTAAQLFGLGTAAASGRLFAEGGSVTSDESVESYLDDLSDQQLAQARQAAIAKQDVTRLQLIEQEMAQRASLRRGIGSAFNALPQQAQQQVVSAAEGGVMRFADEGLVPSAVSPEFGGTLGVYETPEKRTEKRSMAEVSRMADEMRAKGKTVGLSDIQDMLDRRGRYKEDLPAVAPAPSFAKADPPMLQAKKEQVEDTQAKSEPKLTRSEKSAATKVATAVASQTQGNRSDLISDYQRLFAQFKNEDNEGLRGIRDAIAKMNKLPEYDRNDALLKFGLAMAQAGSRPGATLLGSISAAAPELVAHREKYEAEKRAMDRLNAQLQIEQAKYEMALRKDDRNAAISIAGKMQDIQLQKDRLASEERRHRESMGRSQTGLMGIYEQLRKEDPSASAESLLNKAARIQNTGVSMRTESAENIALNNKVQAALEKNMHYRNLQIKMLAEKDPAKQQKIMNDMATIENAEAARQSKNISGGLTSGVTSPPAQPMPKMELVSVQPYR